MRGLSSVIIGGLLTLTLAGCGPGQPAAIQTPQPAPTTGGVSTPSAATPAEQVTPVPAVPPAATTIPPTAPVGPQRISFAPGATTGSVEGAIVRGTEQHYVLGARSGQLMHVQLSALEQNAVFSVFDPAGQPLAGTEPGRDATDWSGTLPTTGDYQITVSATRGNASFHLDVTITDPAAQDQSIRSIDWSALIAADTALEVTQVEGQPYIRVLAANPGVGGHPLLDGIVYVDMDGDGVEEAAIPLNSGGTAGNIGFLVYRKAAPRAQLTAWHDGYKLGLETTPGRLVARNALYAGWEPNCCPSGFTYDTYTLQSGQLQLEEHREEGFAEMQAATVEHFYQLLDQKDLKGAYALLSGTEQVANPFDAWAAGYANTIDVQATVAAEPASANTVRVDLTATDRTSDGGQVVRRFGGTWELVWGGAGHGWQLTNPNLQSMP